MEELGRATISYREAVKPLNKAPKDWTAWILAWQAAAQEAARAGVAGVENALTRWSDINLAIRGVSEGLSN